MVCKLDRLVTKRCCEGHRVEESVYVRLLDEGTLVWRPVEATRLEESRYRLDMEQPEDETWEFRSGAIVRCEMLELSVGPTLVAVSLEPDARS